MAAINAQHITNLIKQSKGFERALAKVNILSVGDGKCKAELKVEEEHTNSKGGLHGGLSALLVDCISTYALSSHKYGQYAHVSVDMHLTYLKGATIGDSIEIDAVSIRTGKTLAFLEVFIRNKETKDILVKGSHTKFILRPS